MSAEPWVRVQPTSGGQLTIGPDMTIRNTGRYATVGSGSYALDVQGTIISDRTDGILRITGSQVTNNGSLHVEQGTLDVNGLRGDVGNVSLAAGGHLDLSGIYTVDQSIPVDAATLTLQGTWQNDATIALTDGATLNVYGTRVNQGTISTTDSVVNLHDNIVLADLGTFTRGGNSTVHLRGTLQNQGLTLTQDANTNWRLDGGRINGGTIDSADATPFIVLDTDGVLDGVVLNADTTLSEGAQVTVVNDLIVNGTVTLNRTSGSGGATFDTGLNFSGGQQTLGGTGEVVLHNTGRSDARGTMGPRAADQWRSIDDWS